MAKGLIIMDIPKSCCDCRLYDCDMDECVLRNREVPYTRPDWCETIPISANSVYWWVRNKGKEYAIDKMKEAWNRRVSDE